MVNRGAVMGAALIWALAAASVPARRGPSGPSYGRSSSRPGHQGRRSRRRALVDRYCVTCHNDRLKTGGLTLQSLDLTGVPADGDVWEKVVRKVNAGMMPPPGLPRPARPAADAFVSFLTADLDRAAVAQPNPGRPLLHRVNRAEYANAIRDLLALDVDVASLLPPDDSSAGFDNIADVLGVSPVLLERYLSAAMKICRRWRSATSRSRRPKTTFRAAGRLDPGPARRRTAARHARRDADSPHVPGRRRIHHQADAVAEQRRPPPRDGATRISSRFSWTASACTW